MSALVSASTDHSTQFRDAIARVGLTPPDAIEADGELHRFASNGKRGDDAGWYVLHVNGVPAGSFGCWRTGVSQTWHAEIGRRLSPLEATARAAEIERQRKQREVDEAKRHAEARERAALAWQAAAVASVDHPYLRTKDVKPHGIRQSGDALLIPMRDTVGELHSLQTIAPDGTKLSVRGGRVAGCYHSIGKPNGVICVAEGYATAASIYEATGHAVAIAFNTGNLAAVARELRAKLPDARIIVCADDDYRTMGNPGLTKATEAARAIGAMLTVPDFGDERPDGATDFNDLARHRGAEAVKRAVASARKPELPSHQPSAQNATEIDLASVDWPKPQPLPDELPKVEAFTLELLPEALRPWIADVAERVQCPPDFPAVAAMIALGSVLGRRISALPKRHDRSWREYPNLWGAIVGRPGILKSPALREALRPLRALESESACKHEGELTAWQIRRAEAEVRRSAAKQNATQAARKGGTFDASEFVSATADEEPQMRRFIVNDSSIEALGEVLRGNPNGTLLYQDELIGLLRQLDKEGNEGARAFYLAGWSGCEPYTFDRIGRGLNRRVDAVCLALLGSIQPAVLGEALREAVVGNGGDGLLARFSMLTWPDVNGDWVNVDRFPDSQAYEAACAVFRRCESLDPAALPDVDLADAFAPGLRFDEAAQVEFDAWRADFERSQRTSDDHPALVAHRDKFRKLVPAVALVCHLADNANGGRIDSASLLRALGWAEYADSHARRAYASVAQPEIAGARELLRRIRAGAVPPTFRVRDVYLKGWTRLSKPEQAHQAARLLADLDYLSEHSEPTGGRSAISYLVNPRALT